MTNRTRAETALIDFFEKQDKRITATMRQMLREVETSDRTTVRMLDGYREQVKTILQDLKKGSAKHGSNLVKTAYKTGVREADIALRAEGLEIIKNVGMVHERSMKVLSEAVSSRFSDVAGVIGRRVDDVFRTVQLDAASGSVMGYETVKDAAHRLRTDLVAKGLTSFRDAGGKVWDMRTYADMAAITVTTQARNRGTWNEYAAHGEDLVIVSTHPMSCPKCQPWQGVVLSITGNTPGYATIQDAEADGLWHPRCRHATALFIPEE